MNQTLQKDIKQTAADMFSAKERLKRTGSQITLAKSASTLANNKLIHGTGTHLEVTSANTNLQRALLNQLQLEFQVCSAQIEYARLTGVKYW
jgi:outer membrane protein TolC